MTTHSYNPRASRFELRFDSLDRPGKSMAFPCDEDGRVDVDALPQRARDNYLFARAMIGREFMYPAVIAA